MRRGKAADPIVLRADMLRRVVESELDEARKLLLANVIETYFELSAEERRRYQRLVSREEYRKVQEVELTWADRLIEQGREAGVIEGKRETLLRQLASKFGPLSPETTARVASLDSAAELDAHLDRVVTAKSLEEIGL